MTVELQRNNDSCHVTWHHYTGQSSESEALWILIKI